MAKGYGGRGGMGGGFNMNMIKQAQKMQQDMQKMQAELEAKEYEAQAGGGVVTVEANYASLHQNGRIYHLLRSLDTLATDGRPLSQGADLAAMWQRRAPLYARFRDAEADNNGTAEETAAAIWRDFCVHCGSERSEFEHAGHPAAGDLRT